MIYVDYPSPFVNSRLSFDDNNLISVAVDEDNGTENWGDEDAIKMVTDVTSGTITIDKSIAPQFANINKITFIRYNYYQPAYHFNCETMDKTVLDDGTLIYSIA